MIRIRAFRAIDDIEACKRYATGHEKVLKSIGVTKVTSYNSSWYTDPNVIVVMAESISGKKVYGGARLHIAGGDHPLPIEEAIGSEDAKIHDLVEKYALKGTAEFCGLWNSFEIADMGIGSLFLVRAGVAKACIVGAGHAKVNSLFALCASYTLRTAKRTGFIVEKSLGDSGAFNYPKPEFKAYATILPDTFSMKSASEEDRKNIQNLRMYPVQMKQEQYGKHVIQIEYDLLIPGHKPIVVKSRDDEKSKINHLA